MSDLRKAAAEYEATLDKTAFERTFVEWGMWSYHHIQGGGGGSRGPSVDDLAKDAAYLAQKTRTLDMSSNLRRTIGKVADLAEELSKAIDDLGAAWEDDPRWDEGTD
jgi:hypothetical protein